MLEDCKYFLQMSTSSIDSSLDEEEAKQYFKAAIIHFYGRTRLEDRRRAVLILECSFLDWAYASESDFDDEYTHASDFAPIEAPFTFSHISPALSGNDDGVVLVPRTGVES